MVSFLERVEGTRRLVLPRVTVKVLPRCWGAGGCLLSILQAMSPSEPSNTPINLFIHTQTVHTHNESIHSRNQYIQSHTRKETIHTRNETIHTHNGTVQQTNQNLSRQAPIYPYRQTGIEVDPTPGQSIHSHNEIIQSRNEPSNTRSSMRCS